MPHPTGLRNPSAHSIAAIGFLLLHPLASAATTTGALARVSIYSELAYSTARACAAGCLVYNGAYPCGVRGYQDLGVALQCGCQSINGCYCNTGLGSSATSYISSCVSAGCSKVENWSVDLTSMLSLYDSYCATANGAVANAPNTQQPATQTSAGSLTTGTTGTAAPKGATNGLPAETAGSGASGTSSADPQQSSAAADSGGLSRSDIVALAASLGVGIPSILIALLTLYFQIKKKRKNAAVAAVAAGGHDPSSPAQSSVQVTQPNNTYGGYQYGGAPSPAPYAAEGKPWQY